MSDIVRRSDSFPEPNKPFIVEGNFVDPSASNGLMRRTDVMPYETYETPQENLQALLAEPLQDGFRPYGETIKVKGFLHGVSQHKATLITDFPTAVPSPDGKLQPATLLERVVYDPTAEWSFRGGGHTKFSGIPNKGVWGIYHHEIGSLVAEPAVIMERAQLPNGKIAATLTPAKANFLAGVIFPRATYLITALGGVTLRDWGQPGLRGEVNYSRPRALTEKQLDEFATNVGWLLDPERYQAQKPFYKMRMATGVNERNNFTTHPEAILTNGVRWFRATRPNKFTYKTPLGKHVDPDD